MAAMILNPFHPNADVDNFPPNKIVYYPVLIVDDRELICDMAYDTYIEAMHHFWFNKTIPDSTAVIRTATVTEYLNMHLSQIKGMNIFWDIGRMEYLDKWNKKYVSQTEENI
jgi:hypothetical protein